jgi:hypothetical protein
MSVTFRIYESHFKGYAYKAWRHIDPRGEESSKKAFEEWWDKVKVDNSKTYKTDTYDSLTRISERIKNQRITS